MVQMWSTARFETPALEVLPYKKFELYLSDLECALPHFSIRGSFPRGGKRVAVARSGMPVGTGETG